MVKRILAISPYVDKEILYKKWVKICKLLFSARYLSVQVLKYVRTVRLTWEELMRSYLTN